MGGKLPPYAVGSLNIPHILGSPVLIMLRKIEGKNHFSVTLRWGLKIETFYWSWVLFLYLVPNGKQALIINLAVVFLKMLVFYYTLEGSILKSLNPKISKTLNL